MQLDERYDAYMQEHPRAWHRDVAAALGVSEVELVHAQCGLRAVALEPRFAELLPFLPNLGPVKTMTRNDAAVMEKWGVFENVEVFGKMAQVVGEQIDLRLFLERWGHLYAVEQAGRDAPRRSLQTFDVHGDSVQKIYIEPDSAHAEYERLLIRFAARSPTPPSPRPKQSPPEQPDLDVDVVEFRRAWDSMQDTHEFFGLLARFGVNRTQALRLAGSERACPVTPDVVEPLLRDAAETSLPIMIFIGNAGAIQIHVGAVSRIERMHGFLNVLDPTVNVHLKDSLVETSWVVRKPTSDGIVTSLEVYDKNGSNIALFFGKRKPGNPENEAWRDLLKRVT